jgi:hypothetical protein
MNFLNNLLNVNITSYITIFLFIIILGLLYMIVNMFIRFVFKNADIRAPYIIVIAAINIVLLSYAMYLDMFDIKR